MQPACHPRGSATTSSHWQEPSDQPSDRLVGMQAVPPSKQQRRWRCTALCPSSHGVRNRSRLSVAIAFHSSMPIYQDKMHEGNPNEKIQTDSFLRVLRWWAEFQNANSDIVDGRGLQGRLPKVIWQVQGSAPADNLLTCISGGWS